ncbi:hypothetical protein SAMN06297251_103247 [Fulvimarina manganoxydans]|uniref:Lipoprotein n=2 Tax=Fulvimarina manganoxydans TaxID=937218 RepID=A0A1W1ZZI2_9HYPH|nr:hypothetical protein [Fulvimarina manganoxydans]SMC53804.1 hypothetical protein SAMN06297251_103247 [Fulvimarina manganoxydans]
MVKPYRAMAFLGLAAIVSACSSTGPGEGLEETAASVAPAQSEWAPGGLEAAYCPKITLRQGTAILDKKNGEELAYSANITGTNRDCRIVDGQLRMKIAVFGRVMPGPAAPGAVTLPIRIAVLRGEDVIYSELGQRQVNAQSGQSAQTFEYVDDRIAFAEPKERNIIIYTGFDEGPPE